MTTLALTVKPSTLAGVLEAHTSLGASDTVMSFPNNGNTVLQVKNGSASPITVTPTVVATVQGMAITPTAVSIAAGAVKMLGPFDPTIFNDANGLVNATIGTPAITVAGTAYSLK